jgi:hypothetical protein
MAGPTTRVGYDGRRVQLVRSCGGSHAPPMKTYIDNNEVKDSTLVLVYIIPCCFLGQPFAIEIRVSFQRRFFVPIVL